MYDYKNTWIPYNKHLCFTTTRNKNAPKHKIPNNEAHLITGDINIKHPMIGLSDLITYRTGKIIEQWLERGKLFKTKQL